VSVRWLAAVAAVTAAGMAAGVVRRGKERAYRRGIAVGQVGHAMVLGEGEVWRLMQTPEAVRLIERMEGMTRLGRKEQP
jgi:hypothetical protein